MTLVYDIAYLLLRNLASQPHWNTLCFPRGMISKTEKHE
jgi:hypothetical protein